MELLQLRYFQTVARFESVTKAAHHHGVPQPSMSQTISKLERELGNVKLFDRINNRLYLNENGKRFLEYVDKALMTLDNGVRNMMTHTGYGLCHAIRMATYNPAEAVHIEDKVGSLQKGKRANLILIDDAVHIKKVFLEGELTVENGEILL